MLLTNYLLASLFGLGAAASPVLSVQQSESGRSCTADTFKNITSFILREYQIDTVTAGDQTQLRGTLGIENPGTGDIYRLDRIPISVGGGVWSVCRPGIDAPLPSELARCQYLLERRRKRIGFRFQWYCDDKDASHPLLFDATVIGELPTEVCVAKSEAADGVTQTCSLAPEAGQVLLSVENIYWEPVSGDGQ